jgi:hypothetical protein
LSRWSHWFSAYLLSQPLLLKHLLEAKVVQVLRVQVLHPRAQEQPLGLALVLQELALQRASLELSLQ